MFGIVPPPKKKLDPNQYYEMVHWDQSVELCRACQHPEDEDYLVRVLFNDGRCMKFHYRDFELSVTPITIH
jgi:hypothetical protein